MNKYRDLLFETFKPDFSIEDFNKVRKMAMKGLCGKPINKGIVGAIFYLMCGTSITQKRIAEIIGVNEVTIRKYIRMMNKTTIGFLGYQEKKRFYHDSNMSRNIFDTIPMFPNMLNGHQISEKTTIKKQIVYAVLSIFVKSGKVERMMVPPGKDGIFYYFKTDR